MAINWTDLVQEMRDWHSDMMEIWSKLADWSTGVAGTVTFNLSAGDTTVDNLAKITAETNGSVTEEAGETITAGGAVRLYDDSGTTKIAVLTGNVENTQTEYEPANDQGAVTCWDSDNSQILLFARQTAAAISDSVVRTATIPSSGEMTYGSAYVVHSTTTSNRPFSPSITFASGASQPGIFVCMYVDAAADVKYRVCRNVGGVITLGTETTIGINYLAWSEMVVKYDETNNMLLVLSLDADTDLVLSTFTVDAATLLLTSPDLNNEVSVGTDNVVGSSYELGFDPETDSVMCFYSQIVSSTKYTSNVRAFGPVSGSPAFSDVMTFDATTWALAEFDIIRIRKVEYISDSKTFLVACEHVGTDNGRTELFLYECSYNPDGAPVTGGYRSWVVESKILFTHIISSGSKITIDTNTGTIVAALEASSETTIQIGKIVDNGIYTTDVYNFSQDMGFMNQSNTLIVDDQLICTFSRYGKVINLDKRYEFCGIAQNSVASGVGGEVSISGGIDVTQTGLVVGRIYYLQKDISFGTNKTPYPVGRAIANNRIKLF